MEDEIALYLTAGGRNGRAKESGVRLEALRARGLTVEHFSLNTGNLLSALLFAIRLGARKRAQVVIATEYYCTFLACLVFRWHRGVKLLSFGLNQSRRLLHFNNALLDGLISRVFRRLDLVVVHSQAEADQFSALHGIPRDRFAFAHWGYDLPQFTSADLDPGDAPTVCMIGRNNRDYESFLRAAERTEFRGLIVAPAYSGLSPQPGKTVEALFDIPMSEVLAHMQAAEVNVVALLDSSRGAGHITMVSAMHLGKPQVVTEASQIADYVFDGFNGLVVPVGDAKALADAITRLLADPALAARLGANGRRLSQNFMSHAVFVERLNTLTEACLSGTPFTFIDPAWVAQRDRMTAGAQACD